MRLDIYHHVALDDVLGIESRLEALQKQGELIMATQEEVTAQLTAVNEKLVKVGTETTTLLEKIAELQQAVVNAKEVTPELQAAVDAVAAQAGVVDDLVPDAV